jgi:hypothetical protein
MVEATVTQQQVRELARVEAREEGHLGIGRQFALPMPEVSKIPFWILQRFQEGHAHRRETGLGGQQARKLA